MRLPSIRLVAGLTFTLLATTGHCQTPGAPDPGFGIGGRILHDFHDRDDRVHAIVPMKDGRLLAAGYVVGPNIEGPGSSPNFVVARFLADGRPDGSFGTNGHFELDIGAGVDAAHALALLPDRSIIAVGNLSPQFHADVAVVKLTPDGALDTGFGLPDGQGGRLGWNLVDLGGSNIHDDGVAVAVQSSGKIVVAGITPRPFGNFLYRRVAVLRFTSDGQIDTTFGPHGNGQVVLDPFESGEGSDYVTAIALDQRGRLGADDSITVVGHTHARNTAFAARMNADGQLDPAFGDGGRTTYRWSASGGMHSGLSTITDARLLPGGRLAVVGTAGDRGITFMRLHGNGGVDTSFGSNGRTTIKFSDPSRNDEPAALAVQGNGRLVAAGYAINTASGTPQKDFFVARVNADGSPDHSFGDGQARAVVALANQTDEAYAIAVEPSGRLLAGGHAQGDGTAQQDFAILRLTGDPDRLFFHDFELPR